MGSVTPFFGLGKPIGRVLDAAENASPVQAVEAVTRELQVLIGATAVSFLIADLSGRGLVRLGAQATVDNPASSIVRHERWVTQLSPELLPYDGGPEELAMRTQSVQVTAPGHARSEGTSSPDWVVLAPVTERGEALGLLEISLPSEPDPEALAEIARVAYVLAFVVIANGRHTDLFEAGQRHETFSLPAEIQRRLLPPSFTCEAGAFTLAGWLEPAAHIGGDTFDYSLGPDELHFSITDAMGHGVGSSLIATLCVGSLRNSRREGVGLTQQAVAANTALRSHGSLLNDGFASGQLGRVNLRSGAMSIVNAGHVLPYLCRSGDVTTLNLPTDLPLGVYSDTSFRATEIMLRKGDRLAFITDGMLERNASNLDLTKALGETSHLHPREATRFLADSVLNATDGALADDATLMMLDWHGTQASGRTTDSGANLDTS